MSDLRLGDLVVHDGRRFVVRGFVPMGVSPQRVLVEDVETHALLQVVSAEVQLLQAKEDDGADGG